MRRVTIFLALGGLAVAAAATSVHFFFMLSFDSTVKTWFKVDHYSEVDMGIDHDFDTGPNPDWQRKVRADEIDLPSDELKIKGTIQHLNSPHGEPANPNMATIDFKVDSENFPHGKQKLGPIKENLPHPPTNHVDEYVHVMSFNNRTNVGVRQQILSYMLESDGYHDGGPASRKGWFPKGQNSVPPTPSQAYGCGLISVRDDGRCDANLAVNGIRPADILSAEIRVAPPGKTGPLVTTLPGAWTDMDGQGASFELSHFAFPLVFLDAFRNGQTYLELKTVSHPEGEIRAQLCEAAVSTHPVSFVVDKGTLMGGGLPELRDADDIYASLVLKPIATRSPRVVRATFEFLAPTPAPLTLSFWVQSRWTSSGQGSVMLEILDLTTGLWRAFPVEVCDAVDRTVEAHVGEDAWRYVESATGRVRARASWTGASRPAVAVDRVNVMTEN